MNCFAFFLFLPKFLLHFVYLNTPGLTLFNRCPESIRMHLPMNYLTIWEFYLSKISPRITNKHNSFLKNTFYLVHSFKASKCKQKTRSYFLHLDGVPLSTCLCLLIFFFLSILLLIFCCLQLKLRNILAVEQWAIRRRFWIQAWNNWDFFLLVNKQLWY